MNRVLCVAALLLAGTAARGDLPPGVKPIHVVLHPASSPAPALGYPLLPELRSLKPGNAVPEMRKAVKTLKAAIAALDDPARYSRIQRWRELPLDQLPREQVRAYLIRLDPALREIEVAVRYEYADWELTDKLRKSGIGTLLPDIQELREFASFLSLRTRLALADGRFEDAHRDIQTTFAIARHLNSAPTLITSLVGIAVGNIAGQGLDELIQHPRAPNLYWAIADLPQPFMDLRAGLQGERIGVYGTFPELPLSPRAEVKPLPPEKIQTYAKLISALSRGDTPIPDSAVVVMISLDMQHKHEMAKQALVEAGWSREVLDRMPHMEVGVLHGFLEYERKMDDATRWNNFPYWQGAPHLLDLDRRRSGLKVLTGPNEPAFPISDLLFASCGRVMFARTRLERKLAALRCLEAIQLYAAKHDGKLPPRLDDIKEAPIPVDPFTGKAFDYGLNGHRATLFAPALAMPIQGRKPNPNDALAYDIEVKR